MALEMSHSGRANASALQSAINGRPEMNRIQIHGRRFAWKTGSTFLGVWELMPVKPIWRLTLRKRLSFAIPRPDSIDRKQIRALILQRMGASTKECEK